MNSQSPGPEPEEAAPVDDEQIARLYDTVRRELYANRPMVAEEAARLLLRKQPESTTAHELMGDVLLAQGKHSAAREQFLKAIEIQPANADAERKYAEATLFVGQTARAGDLMQSGRFDELRGAMNKDLSAAGMRSVLFPGLGQLYKGDYEKGLGAAIVGLIFLGMAMYGIGEFVVSQSRHGDPMSPAQSFAAIFGSVGYAAAILWSIWDAQKN